VPSTIVDATSLPLRVVRQGAVSLERLRDVVPGLLDIDGNAAGTDAPSEAAPADGAPGQAAAEPAAGESTGGKAPGAE